MLAAAKTTGAAAAAGAVVGLVLRAKHASRKCDGPNRQAERQPA